MKAVIFDMDGTLIDSVEFHALAWQAAFREFGHDFDLATIRRQIGKGGDQLMPVFIAKPEIERIGKQIEDRRGKIFAERYLSQIKPFPAVRDLFERLLADGTRVALASSAKSEELKAYKRIAGISDLLDAETSSDDAEESKPHPDIFEAALEKLGGLAPAEVIAIGDTPYDAQAAGKAGIRTIGLLCGGWSEPDLREAGCVEVYRDPADLLAHYEASALS
ncbi:MAG: family hydrolase [Hyphomicrobiales bacterium]|nr:family hydrolase [Hyphomicrobiales bacterium]